MTLLTQQNISPEDLVVQLPPMRVGCRYKLQRRKAITDEHGNRVAGPVVEETPWVKNTLTLYYFNQAFTATDRVPYGCVVGSGNNTPAETDTALQTFVAGVGNTGIQAVLGGPNNHTSSPRWAKGTWRWRFGEGVAAGNISEAGVTLVSGANTAVTPIISRCLLVDNTGTPITVTVLSDEFLDVTWECYWYVPEDVTGTVSIDIDGVPTNFNYTVRAIGMAAQWWLNGTTTIGQMRIGALGPSFSATSGAFNGQTHSSAATTSTLIAYDSDPSGASANRVINVTAAAYTPNSKQREFTLNWGLNEANIAIRTILLTVGGNGGLGLGRFQILLDAPLTKVNTKVLQLKIVSSLAQATPP